MLYVTDTVKWVNDNAGFIQALLVFGGLLFAGYQLSQARRSFQATVVSQISERSAELQWAAIKDPELLPLLGVANPTAETKRALVLGVIINHYALVYDLWRLKGIPNHIWETFKSDLSKQVSQPDFHGRWLQLKRGHRPDFVSLVDSLLSESTAQRLPQVEPNNAGTKEESTRNG